MRFGAHLPMADLDQGSLAAPGLRAYTRTAAELGYTTLSANDHLIWKRPWLDGPTTLTSVHADAGDMTLATSVSLPVIRHPVVLAKWLTTLGHLTDNRIVAGLGPGSSAADYEAVGIPFDQRWARFDAALRVVRAAVRGEDPPANPYFEVGDLRLDPLPTTPPEVWFGSWGSDHRLRAMATVADGWMASAYNTTPSRFARARERLDEHLAGAGRDPTTFPDLIATMWLYVTDDRGTAERLIEHVLAGILGRDPDELAAQLPVGPVDHCVQLLRDYRDAGAREVLVWPLRDPVDQLGRFAEHVIPEVG